MAEKTSTKIIPLQISEPTAIPMEDAIELRRIFTNALKDYHQSGLKPKEWSKDYFIAQLPEKSEDEIVEWVEEIDSTLVEIETKKQSIAEARKSGIGVDDWFARDVQSMTAQMSSQKAAAYIDGLDTAVQNMNQTWSDVVITNSGIVNMNPNLNGFMAEAHHVNSFNAKAAASGSPYRAEVLKPGDSGYNKNSVDIVIRDANGKIVRRYQSKYGANSDITSALFEQGDYRGQRKLVPKGQDVTGATDHIGIDDINSDPLTKENAKQKQDEAQTTGKAPTENYNAFDTKVMLKNMGKDVAMAGTIAAGMNVAFEIGSKLAQGEDIELEDVAVAAVKGGSEAAIKTVAASAVKVAIEKDALKFTAPLKGIKLGPLVAAIDIGISNIRAMFKIGNGDFTLKEGIYQIESNTIAGVAGFIGAAKGAAIGAGIGAILGPVGAAVGGFAGGVVGGMAGSTVGRAIAKGVQSVRDVVWEGVKAAKRGVTKLIKGASDVMRGLKSHFAGQYA